MKKKNSIFKDNKKNKKKNNLKKTRKIKKKAGSPLITEIEKEENMKREISNNLVISYLLAINLDFSEIDARSKAANLNNLKKREYVNIVLIMQMELNELIHKSGASLDEISTQDALFISRIMVNHRGDMEKLRDIIKNNLTIGDLGGGKKRKNKMSRWSYVKRCSFNLL